MMAPLQPQRAKQSDARTPAFDQQQPKTVRPQPNLLGNQALQRKLKLSQPHDTAEVEADRAAESVINGQPAVQIAASPGSTVQRKCAWCEDEEKIQRKEAPGALTGQSKATEAAPLDPGPGEFLPVAERSFFEPRFGLEFSQVRIHHGSRAARSAESVSAKAYTIGQHVVFGEGNYAPNTDAGRRLLAHELAHVVQQSQDGSSAVRDRASLPEQAARLSAHGLDTSKPKPRLATPHARDARANGRSLLAHDLSRVRQQRRNADPVVSETALEHDAQNAASAVTAGEVPRVQVQAAAGTLSRQTQDPPLVGQVQDEVVEELKKKYLRKQDSGPVPLDGGVPTSVTEAPAGQSVHAIGSGENLLNITAAQPRLGLLTPFGLFGSQRQSRSAARQVSPPALAKTKAPPSSSAPTDPPPVSSGPQPSLAPQIQVAEEVRPIDIGGVLSGVPTRDPSEVLFVGDPSKRPAWTRGLRIWKDELGQNNIWSPEFGTATWSREGRRVGFVNPETAEIESFLRTEEELTNDRGKRFVNGKGLLDDAGWQQHKQERHQILQVEAERKIQNLERGNAEWDKAQSGYSDREVFNSDNSVKFSKSVATKAASLVAHALGARWVFDADKIVQDAKQDVRVALKAIERARTGSRLEEAEALLRSAVSRAERGVYRYREDVYTGAEREITGIKVGAVAGTAAFAAPVIAGAIGGAGGLAGAGLTTKALVIGGTSLGTGLVSGTLGGALESADPGSRKTFATGFKENAPIGIGFGFGFGSGYAFNASSSLGRGIFIDATTSGVSGAADRALHGGNLKESGIAFGESFLVSGGSALLGRGLNIKSRPLRVATGATGAGGLAYATGADSDEVFRQAVIGGASAAGSLAGEKTSPPRPVTNGPTIHPLLAATRKGIAFARLSAALRGVPGLSGKSYTPSIPVETFSAPKSAGGGQPVVALAPRAGVPPSSGSVSAQAPPRVTLLDEGRALSPRGFRSAPNAQPGSPPAGTRAQNGALTEPREVVEQDGQRRLTGAGEGGVEKVEADLQDAVVEAGRNKVAESSEGGAPEAGAKESGRAPVSFSQAPADVGDAAFRARVFRVVQNAIRANRRNTIGAGGEAAALASSRTVSIDLNAIKKNSPQLDSASRESLASVKTFGVHRDLTESVTRRYLKELRALRTAVEPGVPTKLGQAAELLASNREAIQAAGAWPSGLGRNATPEQIAKFINRQGVLAIPADHVRALRRAIFRDAVADPEAYGLTLGPGLAKGIRRLTSRVQSLGLTSDEITTINNGVWGNP